VKGPGRREQQQQQQKLWGRKGNFVVHASVYGKVQAEDNVNPNNQERKGKKKVLVLARLGCLATYVVYVPYVSLSRLEGVSTTPQWNPRRHEPVLTRTLHILATL
jgi:hypothetical protein